MHLLSPSLVAALAVLAAAAGSGPAAAEDTSVPAWPAAVGAPSCSAPVGPEAVRARELSRTERALVREANELTAGEMSEVVGDAHGWVDPCGAVFYTEPARTEAQQEATAAAETPSVDAAGVPSDVLDLSSRPGSSRTIYLDFTGDTTTGTAWNQQYGATIASPAYSINAPADAAFDDAERAAIHLAWRTVAEDFAPFDVNVTTREPSASAITRSSSSDTTYGTRVVITSTNAVGSGCRCGGLAYVDVLDKTGGQYYQPAWVFTSGTGTGGYNVAQAISHEVGHNFGLQHDGTVATATSAAKSYYSGGNGWAPIMGSSYGRRLSQWSNGQYAAASTTQDDVAVIARSAPLLADDHAAGPVGATPLSTASPVAGIVGSRTDVDSFSFVAWGATTLTVAGPAGVSDLDVALTIVDGSGATVAHVDPVATIAVDASLDAVWSATLPTTPGSYTALVDGAGHGDPLVLGGYDDYGSLGAYTVTLTTNGTALTTTPTSTTPMTTTTTPTTTTTTTTTVPTTEPPTVRKPRFRSDRKLAAAAVRDSYREVIRFAGAAESVRVRGLPKGLSWDLSDGRIVLQGRPRRSGQLDVVVVLAGADDSVRRTFLLRVR